jgi:hemolysin activation/secretion protein
MLVLRLRPALIAAAAVVICCMPLVIAPTFAIAQQQAPLLQGPGQTRPELPDAGLADDDTPIARGRTLPVIQIPEDDTTATALSGGAIAITAFHFSGNLALSDAELEAVTASYLGEGRRYSALLEARDRVTRAYVDAGYISSGAVLPPQDFAEGIVNITIVEGQLTSIEVTTDGRLRERYFTSRLFQSGGTLNVNTLRESLRLLKRDSRVNAVAAELTPGDQRGESLLTISVEEAVPYWSRASFDNYASEAVGGLRGSFRGGYINASGWGDSWSAAYSVAEGLNDVDVRVEVPVSRWDTSLEIWMRRAWSEIVENDIADIFDIDSETQSYGVRISQPVVRKRGEDSRLFFAADWKRGQSFLANEKGLIPGDPNEGESTVMALRVGWDYMLRLRRRAIAARVTLSVGLDALGATKSSEEGFADGEFLSALIQLQAVEYLPWYAMRIQSRFDVQLTDSDMLGLEQFALGGHSSVRGYRENLAVRDMGAVASIELRAPLPLVKHIERLELGVFLDAGVGRDVDSPHGQANLASIGLGLHTDITSYLRMSVQWAHGLVDSNAVTGNELQDDGLQFSLQARFP